MRLTAQFVFVFIAGYTLLFGFAARSYERRWLRFLEQSSAVYTQIIANHPDSSVALLPIHKKRRPSNPPNLWHPRSVVCQFFCRTSIDTEMQNPLRDALLAFKAHLPYTNLSRMYFRGKDADLRGADLRQSDLSGADFSRANLSEARLSGAKLNKARLIETNFKAADLSASAFVGARVSGADLQGARMSDADLTRADFRGAKLQGADLRGVNFFYSDFLGADLEGADLRRVRLSGADFREAKFNRSKLNGAVLTGARLQQADLSESDLKGADLRHADLSETIGLTPGQLHGVIVDEKTKLPKGLVLPRVSSDS